MSSKKNGLGSDAASPEGNAGRSNPSYARTLKNLMTKQAVSEKLAEPDHPVQKALSSLVADFTPDTVAALAEKITRGQLVETAQAYLFGDDLSPDERKLAYSAAASLSELSPELLNQRSSMADALDPDGQPTSDFWFQTMSRIDRATARRGVPGRGDTEAQIYETSHKFEAMKLFPDDKAGPYYTCELHADRLVTLKRDFPWFYPMLEAGDFTTAYPLALKLPKSGGQHRDRDFVIRCLAAEQYIRRIEDSQRVHAYLPRARQSCIPAELRLEVDASKKVQMAGIMQAQATFSRAVSRVFALITPVSAPDDEVVLKGRPSPFIDMANASAEPLYDALDRDARDAWHTELVKLSPVARAQIEQGGALPDGRVGPTSQGTRVAPRHDVITHWYGATERALLLLVDIRLLQSRAITRLILEDPGQLVGQGVSRFMHPSSMGDKTGVSSADLQRLCREMAFLSRIRGASESYRWDVELGIETDTNYIAESVAYDLLGKFERRRATGSSPMCKSEAFFNHFDPLRGSPKPKKAP